MEELLTRYPALSECKEDISAALDLIIDTYKNKKKILVCGNGGSAADSEHIVGELMKGFMKKRSVNDERMPKRLRDNLQGALPAISLPSQTAVLSAFINDVAPDMMYAQLVYGYADEGDLVIGISTSGNSQNIVNAIETAREAGFQYIRFHNILSSQVGIYHENEAGEPVYDFEKFNKIFDTIIQNGMLPFMEISFCPEALKCSEKVIMHYKGSTSKPSSYEKWTQLIKKIICNVIERYGIKCVKKWYFEVWNEPDLIFFDGGMEDYFELYDYTVLAIKSVNQSLKVGGPATSKCAWISEFIEHIETGSKISGFKPLPCDFIATHAYPSDLPFLSNAAGKVELQKSEVLLQLYSSVKERIDNSSLKGIPLIMGEWNSSAGPLAWNHDEKNNAAFIVKAMSELKDIKHGKI